MKVKVSKASGVVLDWMVAKCEGALGECTQASTFAQLCKERGGVAFTHRRVYSPSTNWAQGGPILSRECISRTIDHSGLWIAYWTDGYVEGDEGMKWMQCDRSELVAGLRCYVASKLGDEVDVPEEIL